MRAQLGALGLALVCLVACSSKPLADAGASQGGSADTSSAGQDSGGANDGGGQNSGGAGPTITPSQCTSALRESLALVEDVATADVTLLDDSGGALVVYVDASAGGINGADTHAWVYLSLETGKKVTVGDLDALQSLDWDIAFKRYIVRTNSGDSGPGKGGALRVTLPWDQVDHSTLGGAMVPAEQWFDADCKLTLDANGELVTTYSGWSEYDEANHVLNAADAVFITASADGTLYKVQILDYYSTATGGHGSTAAAGHYKLRVAPLP